MADVTPFYKKESRTVKDNFYPVSILPNLSKVFERYLYKQFLQILDNIFSKKQCGFRKNYGAQRCLLALLEKRKGNVGQGKVSWPLLTNLLLPRCKPMSSIQKH